MIGHDLGAALVAFAELVARVLGQRLHPLADRALGIAERSSGSGPSGRAARQLVEAHLVDLVGRHVGGGRGLERPAVIFVAAAGATTCRPSSVATARSALSSAIWRWSAGDDLGRVDDPPGARVPIAGDVLVAGPLDRAIRPASPPSRAPFERDVELGRSPCRSGRRAGPGPWRARLASAPARRRAAPAMRRAAPR